MYILIIPSLCICSISIDVYSIILIGSIVCIGYLGMVVYIHHLYIIGLDMDIRCMIMCITWCISIPTGSKCFNYMLVYECIVIIYSLSFI